MKFTYITSPYLSSLPNILLSSILEQSSLKAFSWVVLRWVLLLDLPASLSHESWVLFHDLHCTNTKRIGQADAVSCQASIGEYCYPWDEWRNVIITFNMAFHSTDETAIPPLTTGASLHFSACLCNMKVASAYCQLELNSEAVALSITCTQNYRCIWLTACCALDVLSKRYLALYFYVWFRSWSCQP